MILNKILETLRKNPKGLNDYRYFIDDRYLTLHIQHDYDYDTSPFLDADNIVFIIKDSTNLQVIYNTEGSLK